ncbi:MAG: M18 family aminopeptidase [Lachnospiraceae bacterium]|nr:M18 family aminopeptidase [Lachnospiraceae bacterium]
MQDWEEQCEELLHFIDESPSAFHAVANLAALAGEKGYMELQETEDWKLVRGGRYYVKRNDSTIAAFSIPDIDIVQIKGFHIAAAHSDSPTFKIKDNPEMPVEEQYVKLNTEKYGGMLPQTWLDRALSVAGRIAVKQGDEVSTRLVNVDKDLLVIPNLAIHMNREAGKGQEYNAQTDLLPLYGEAKEGRPLSEHIAEAAGVKKEEILAHDLFLYVREKGRRFGGNAEYILSPRLDDLQCSFAAMTAMAESCPKNYINICVIFDNEEVGSTTRQGADSSFLQDVLFRVKEALGQTDVWLRKQLANSLLISADNAHAVHPNHPEKADPTNRPFLNGGIVLKYHGGQKYTTDAYTGAILKELCKRADVPVQTYFNRSDIPGGSTLGNISAAHVSVPSVDIGLPQLAMHSAAETAGARDTEYAIRMFKVFYED